MLEITAKQLRKKDVMQVIKKEREFGTPKNQNVPNGDDEGWGVSFILTLEHNGDRLRNYMCHLHGKLKRKKKKTIMFQSLNIRVNFKKIFTLIY